MATFLPHMLKIKQYHAFWCFLGKHSHIFHFLRTGFLFFWIGCLQSDVRSFIDLFVRSFVHIRSKLEKNWGKYEEITKNMKNVRMHSGVMRMARDGSGAKAPPLVARPNCVCPFELGQLVGNVFQK